MLSRGKTYDELYGPERAAQLRELRGLQGRKNKGKRHTLQINKTCVCKVCNNQFASASKFKKYCQSCLSDVEKNCACGCGGTVIRKKYEIALGYSLYKKGHLMSSRVSGKTYEEIYGIDKADAILSNISCVLRKTKKRVYNRKRQSEFICKYCNTKFMAADVKAYTCPDCYKKVEVKCSCGCEELFLKYNFSVRSSERHFKHGHHSRVPDNAFLNHKARPSSLEKVISPYLRNWISQYKIKWYTVDFALPEQKKVIEVNGCYWHNCCSCGFAPKSKTGFESVRKDNQRYSFLQNHGWDVEVIWEHDIKKWIADHGEL